MCLSAEKAGVEGLVDGLSEEKGLLRGGTWIRHPLLVYLV